MKNSDKARRLCHLALCAVAALVTPQMSAAAGPELERQRELFKELHPVVERGDWSVVRNLPKRERQLLRNYVLWPDLRSTYLKATIKSASHEHIEAFLHKYGTLKPARELRYRYALHLARSGDHDAYLDIYESFYQGIGEASLDCLALQAELDQGREARVVNRMLELWLVGRSQVDECDPVFEWARNSARLGKAEYRQRFDLAIAERQFTLARWLGRAIDEQHALLATEWLLAQQDPEKFLRTHTKRGSGESDRAQLVYAVERLTYADPLLAAELWDTVRNKHRFSDGERHATARHIALWMARDRLPGAYAALSTLPAEASDDEVARWRARLSLLDQQWKKMLRDIERLSAKERNSEEWRYWSAYARLRSGRDEEARVELRDLAGERSYYGFLAADLLAVRYEFDHADSQADEAVIAEIAAKPEVIRARELFMVGLDGRGRSEWDHVIGFMNDNEKTQAAILADRWGWHSRAISTVARVGEYDDLEIRYPLAFLDVFQRSSEQASIPPTWAFGIARSESLFMRDVRSHAGAVGLMQLMPATGKQVARDLRLPFSGLTTLTNPESNIQLGTTYLGQMSERYGGNRVLATAAYNAGPHRVDQWLPQQGQLDARIWIENIPYNETRKYVRRVFTAETIFHWRMTGKLRRLSQHLQPVRAFPGPEQLASR